MRGTARLPEVVTVDEKTVQKAAQGLVDLPRRRFDSGGHPAVINDFRITIPEAIWSLIKDRVQQVGMASVQILGPTDYVVWNYPYTEEMPWPTMK